MSEHSAPTRENDERVIAWVRDRAAGKSPKQIAKAYRTFPEAVLVATDRVRDEDTAMSGEDITGFYW